MANPQVPAQAPGVPPPPPVAMLPWSNPGPGGMGLLTPASLEFLQLLWSYVVGSSSFATVVATVPLEIGDLVNIWDNAGTPNARKADATFAIADPRDAHGFVVKPGTPGTPAGIWFSGRVTPRPGLAGGPVYLGADGLATSTPNATPGEISQQVGICYGEGFIFAPQSPVGL